MKKMKMLVLPFGLALMLCVSGVANGAVITFDDLPSPSPNPIPNGYEGFNWSNVYANDPLALGFVSPGNGEGYVNGVVSPKNDAYNGNGDDATISKVGTFDFNGAYFTSAWFNNNVLTLTGKANGTTLFSLTANLMTSSPSLWVQANFTGIDELDFSTSAAQFAMDNFTYTAVPEPSTILLIGSGILGLAGYGKKKFFKK